MIACDVSPVAMFLILMQDTCDIFQIRGTFPSEVSLGHTCEITGISDGEMDNQVFEQLVANYSNHHLHNLCH